MTPPRSRWRRSAAGGTPSAGPPTRDARRLLITADAGGSNGYRTGAWKAGLANLAARAGLEITVCHFPPGTSKWNKIEHRLFCHVSMNWRGRPLTSHEVVVNTIAATTTTTGLTVTATLDTGEYPDRRQDHRRADARPGARALTRHGFHGAWNYTLHPAPAPARPAPAPRPPGPPRRRAAALAHPALTGMPRHDLDALAAALGAPPRPAQARPRRQGPGHLPAPAPPRAAARPGLPRRRPPLHHQLRRHPAPASARPAGHHHHRRPGPARHPRRPPRLRRRRRHRPAALRHRPASRYHIRVRHARNLN